MPFLDTLLHNSTMPLLTAFLLGLMTIFSPCPFCSNITAIGFIGKDVSNRRAVLLNGFMYVVGKMVVYTVLSLIFLLGAQIEGVQHFFETYGEPVLGPFLIVCGLFMLIGGHHEQHHDHEHNHGLAHKIEHLATTSYRVPDWLWAFVLGVVFSLAFCPYSGVMFFGMLVPLTMAQPLAWSWLMPVLFGLGTGLPVIIIAWILSYSMMGIGKLNNRIRQIEVWLRTVCAVLFIGMGIYLCVAIFGGHHHHDHDRHSEAVECVEGHTH